MGAAKHCGGQQAAGFTLIEMVAVVMILGLVTTLVARNVVRHLEWARVETTKMRMKILDGSLEMFRMENYWYPTTEQGLLALVERPTLAPEPRRYPAEGYLSDEEALADAWERPFGYRSPGDYRPASYDLWSDGRDGRPGGDGPDADITNWKRARQ